jgi:CheY-like chemotaxis protein
MCTAAPPRRPGVLVVADEPCVLSVLSALLRMEGFAPLQAENAHTALAALRAHPGEIDAALIQQQTPGHDGAAACRRLREAEPGLRCWLLAPGVGAASPGGFEGRLAKPFTLGQLRACLAEVRTDARRRAARHHLSGSGQPGVVAAPEGDAGSS